MNKKFIFALTSIFAILFTSCKSQNTNQDLSAKDIADKIIHEIGKDSMTQIPSEKIENYYDTDTNKIDDFCIYIEASGAFADEIAVFKAKSKDDVKAVEDSITDRIESQKKVFDGYNAKELSKLEDNLVTENGNYVLFVVSDNNDKAKEIFQKAFK